MEATRSVVSIAQNTSKEAVSFDIYWMRVQSICGRLNICFTGIQRQGHKQAVDVFVIEFLADCTKLYPVINLQPL
jgi:hypothetical protein